MKFIVFGLLWTEYVLGYLGYRPRGKDPDTRLAFFSGMWTRGYMTARLEDGGGRCAGCDDPDAAAGAGAGAGGGGGGGEGAFDAVRAAFDGSGFETVGPSAVGVEGPANRRAWREEVESGLHCISHAAFTASNEQGQVQIFRISRRYPALDRSLASRYPQTAKL